ncbi:hypothetical protein H5410_008571 [Solanum commersonii]|uniref:Uncharacterized protein n=1 Tax=Solanum commersonii TaxID=4109 RepID=A0A9J6AG17_SOLCO|nr:hypothetical protein H5410_008571 [Solanum commersonii]
MFGQGKSDMTGRDKDYRYMATSDLLNERLSTVPILNKFAYFTIQQVKHYREEDCPSKVGRGSQQHPQLQRMHQSIFHLNEEWHVVTSEESKEAGDQDHKKKRVRLSLCRSAIPPKYF